jgi:hypothetical protein
MATKNLEELVAKKESPVLKKRTSPEEVTNDAQPTEKKSPLKKRSTPLDEMNPENSVATLMKKRELPGEDKESVTPFKTDKFITIREFIMYYGYEVMQRFFGANVWVKTLNDGYMNFFDGEDNYKIYIDVKTAAEVAYVKDQGGCIVNVIGSKSKKSSLIAESESDFNILYSNSPVDLQESVMNVVKRILECKEDM